jgi:hypothetical protein
MPGIRFVHPGRREVIDREQVAEALARPLVGLKMMVEPDIQVIVAAARAWLDQGDALVIRRQKNGEWPRWLNPIDDHYDIRIPRDDRPSQPSCLGDVLDRIERALSDRSDTP